MSAEAILFITRAKSTCLNCLPSGNPLQPSHAIMARIAFEHCPQGAYHLPVMHYNCSANP